MPMRAAPRAAPPSAPLRDAVARLRLAPPPHAAALIRATARRSHRVPVRTAHVSGTHRDPIMVARGSDP